MAAAGMSVQRAGRWKALRARAESAAADASAGAAGFGLRLAAARVAKKLAISDLAAAAGFSHATLRRLERGEVSPSLSDVEAISKALRIGPLTLVRWSR